MSKLPKEILQEARDLISDPNKWTRGASARTIFGVRACPDDEDAAMWCAAGALNKVAADSSSWIVASKALSLAAERRYGDAPEVSISWVNDIHGHAAALQLFDDAIASMKDVDE